MISHLVSSQELITLKPPPHLVCGYLGEKFSHV